MSKRISIASLVPMAALVLGIVGAFSCGGGGSSSSNQAICNSVCQKYAACTPDGGALIAASCMAGCASQVGSTSTTTCTNASAIASAANACLAMTDCMAFETCFTTIPDCQAGASTGTGGAGGAKGGGVGGSSGTSAGCASCTKFDACCSALAVSVGQSPTGCTTAPTCNQSTASEQATLGQVCQQELTQLAAAAPTLAACK